MRDIRTAPWSRIYARTLLSWYSHVQRHPDSLPALTLREQGFDWVSGRRSALSSTAEGAVTRTGTRAGTGYVYRLDQIGWTERFNPEGSSDAKRLDELATGLLDALGVSSATPSPTAP